MASRIPASADHGVSWIVDCTAETVEVYRGPGPDGYRDVSLVAGAATLPDVELRTTEIFA